MQHPGAFSKSKFLNIKGQLQDFSKPCIMGILNITPDSFYSGSRFSDEKTIHDRIHQVFSEGARTIDIGAYSSRPGAEDIDIAEEKLRLILALKILKNEFPDAIISLDTFRSEIVRWAVGEFGVSIINDISGGMLDADMFKTIAELKVPYILMHMRGTPQNMVNESNYKNVVKDVIYELAVKVNNLHEMGVHDIIIDPGFGFAKNIQQNYELLYHLDMFKLFNHLVMVGLSRKSMIYKTLGITPEESLNGTTVLNTIALQKGADLLRVHDVKAAVEVLKIMSKFNYTEQI